MLTAVYIMIGVDAEAKAVAVPPLIVVTEEEERLSSKGLTRYQARKTEPGE